MFPALGEEPDEIETLIRKSTLVEIMSGLPDDSREEDDRQEDQLLGNLQGRAKRARAVVASETGLVGILASDKWNPARFGTNEATLPWGVPPEKIMDPAQDTFTPRAISRLM